MLLKNSPWAAGVHSLSAVRPWGQGGRERGGDGEKNWGARKRQRMGVRRINVVKYRGGVGGWRWDAKRERWLA